MNVTLRPSSVSSTHESFSLRIRAGLFLLGVFLFCNSRADELSKLWQLGPGDRPYLTTGNTERGLAFNPLSTNLVLVSRTGGITVVVLDPTTGAELRMLNVDGISGGTFALNMIGATDDGVLYGANLSTSTTAPNFKIYRWANDQADTIPSIAFDGDPAGLNTAGASNNPQRWGDSFDVRGSGPNTMIAAASRASSAVAIFTTTDGVTFTAQMFTNAAPSAGSLGIAFGEGNTIWLKSINVPLRHIEFNLTTGQAALLKEWSDPAFPNAIPVVAVNASKKWLGGFTLATPDQARLYDISTASDVALIAQENLPTDNANANGTGSLDFGALGSTNALFVLDTNNALVAYRIVTSQTSPPIITTEPEHQTVLEGANVSFTVAAKGTTPFQYQWQFNNADIVTATNSILSLTNVQRLANGNYRVKITNVAGAVTSANAGLNVAPIQSDALTPLWKIAPGDRPYVNTDGTQRGITFNPVTGNVLLVSRTGGNKIYVLDGKTGAELRQLNVDPAIVTGGTFAVNMVSVADDGAVYAANLVTDSASAGFVIYRWENDSATAVPTAAFQGDPSGGSADAANRRFGDSFDVRGAGANTQMLAGSRNGKNAAIFTTADGSNFRSIAIMTDAAAGDLGLGVAFGSGNSFWGTATGRPVRMIEFDLAAGTGATKQTFGANAIPTAVCALAVDPLNKLLAGIAVETPDDLLLFNIANLPSVPTPLDREVFPTDNLNLNGTGSADFGGGRLFAIDSNNGVLAFTVKTEIAVTPKPASLAAPSRQPNGPFQFTVTGSAGSYVVEATADFKVWTPISTVSINASGSIQITDSNAATQSLRFYRAVLKP